MTFDDGIVKIYGTKDVSVPGAMPKIEQILKSEHFFGFDVLGYNRYYTALQAHQEISAVVNIPEWHDEGITSLDIAELENGQRYKIRMVQPMKDENGLKITKLTLEKVVAGNA